MCEHNTYIGEDGFIRCFLCGLKRCPECGDETGEGGYIGVGSGRGVGWHLEKCPKCNNAFKAIIEEMVAMKKVGLITDPITKKE